MTRSRAGQTYRGCYVPARAPAVKERDWQQVIIDAAKVLGYRVYHTFDSRKSAPGFPDLILVKPPRLLVIECKTEMGRLTPAQVEWLADLADVESIEVMLARPSMWDEIESALKGEA